MIEARNKMFVDKAKILIKAGNGGNGYCNVYLEEGCTWTVTGDSTVTSLESEGDIVDTDGKTVSIVGTDGTVYIEGDSAYTITTGMTCP